MLLDHSMAAERATLSLMTRLRLKQNNLLVREPPSFATVFDRLAGRINSLCALYGGGPLLDYEEKHRLLSLAEDVCPDPLRSTARWVEWERPAQPGKERMSFGGLLGDLAYSGDLTPFLPLLRLGQWTGFGGKTSFGLGMYHLGIETVMSEEWYE
jgi:hypothetical protein